MVNYDLLKDIKYMSVSKVTENVYQFLQVSFNKGAICEDGSIIPAGDKFDELYYYPNVNKFWVPLTSKRVCDRMVCKW